MASLAVMVIVGGILMVQMNLISAPSRQRSPEITAASELNALRIALERFRHDCGRYPHVGEGLKALVLNPGVTGWGGPYVNLVKRDPWHMRYVYDPGHGEVVLFSCGRDKKPGTSDDLRPNAPGDVPGSPDSSGELPDHRSDNTRDLQ